MAALNILYFAWVREKIGRDEDRLDDVDPEDSVAAIVARLESQSEGHSEALAEQKRLRFALDQQFVQPDARIGSACELAIFPPVTGG